MYPRNAASPEPIAIGAVVQISDGAVQTSGCTVRIKPIGVAEGDGAGSTSYSTDGVVYYTPTQAETNYTSFILIAKKTGCIPVGITVVTTASSVPGRTMPADGSVTAAVIATDAIDADSVKADAVTKIQSGLALAATALSNVQWTNALATALGVTNADLLNGGRLDLIFDVIAQDTTTDIPTLISTAFASLQVNTRANLQVPVEIETPDTGTQVFKIKLHLFDVEGNMEAPDSTPTIALVNAAGTDRSSRLSAATVVSTGAYSWDYTATAADAEEQLNWMFTVVEGGLTRLYPATSYVVEETAYRFSSTDRNTLNAAATQVSVNDLPTNAELAVALAGGVNVNAVDGSSLNAHGIGMFPADVRDWNGLGATIAVDAENNAPSVAVSHVHEDAIAAASVSAAAVTKIQNGLATGTSLSTVGTNVSAIQTILTGITSLGDWLRRAFRKDAGTDGMIAAEAEIDTGGTSTFTGTTDSLEAIRDASGGSGGSGDASQTTLLEVQDTVDALAISLAGTAITVVNRVTGGTINAVMGDDYKVRSGSELPIVVSDPAGALHTRLAAIGVGNLAFGASRVGEAAGEITGTIASLAYLSDVLTIVVEITACGASLRPDNYTYQIQSSQTQGSEVDDVVEVTGRLVLSRRTVAAVS